MIPCLLDFASTKDLIVPKHPLEMGAERMGSVSDGKVLDFVSKGGENC